MAESTLPKPSVLARLLTALTRPVVALVRPPATGDSGDAKPLPGVMGDVGPLEELSEVSGLAVGSSPSDGSLVAPGAMDGVDEPPLAVSVESPMSEETALFAADTEAAGLGMGSTGLARPTPAGAESAALSCAGPELSA